MKNKRDINGILLLDKPKHLSSNAALQRVKRLFNARKAGHTGSLDPLATGMLPICFGEATKFSQFLLNSDKTYRTIARLGIKTATADAEGEVLNEREVPAFTNAEIEACLKTFRGKQQQIPSMYSALKHQGKPLYELARQGIEVERKARDITIYRLDCLDSQLPYLTLYVHCSKGTYIRNLVEDIGEHLGCGAHVLELRRLSVAEYKTKDMISLEALENMADDELMQRLQGIDSALYALPSVTLDEAATQAIKHGQTVEHNADTLPGLVRLLTIDQRFLGVGEQTSEGKIAPKRLIATA